MCGIRIKPVSYTHLDVYKRQTGAIAIKTHMDEAWEALADPNIRVVAQIAPAVRVEMCIRDRCCSVRCPAGISHPMVGLLARRLTGKYIAPEAKHLTKRVEEIHEGA